MIENIPKREKSAYTPHDLLRAEQALRSAAEILNSFDLSDKNVNMAEAMKVKKAWEEAYKNQKEIYYYLHPDQNE